MITSLPSLLHQPRRIQNRVRLVRRTLPRAAYGQALLGRDLTVCGEGLQTRSFCYVDDLIDGLVLLDGGAARHHRSVEYRKSC
jgi:nucleoside-diphosphate-sugar epimerase